jgi:hypothetical protein
VDRLDQVLEEIGGGNVQSEKKITAAPSSTEHLRWWAVVAARAISCPLDQVRNGALSQVGAIPTLLTYELVKKSRNRRDSSEKTQ